MKHKSQFYLHLFLLFVAIGFNSYAQNFWEPTKGPYKGTIYVLAVHPSGDIYAGIYDDGVYRSTDNGKTWNSLKTGLLNLYVSSIAFNSSGDIYIGTYGYFQRSSDNGKTWKNINLGINYPKVTNMMISKNGNILVGTEQGLFRSTDDGNNWIKQETSFNYIHSLFADTSGKIYATSSYNVYIDPNQSYQVGTIHRSTDNGLTWKQLNVPTSRWFPVLRTNSRSEIYVINGTVSGGKGVLYSANNGTTWTILNLSTKDSTFGSLLVGDNDELYVGSYISGAYHSSDNGTSWNSMNNTFENLSVWSWGKKSPGLIFAGTNDGVFSSSDNGLNWSQSVEGFTPNTSVPSLSFDSKGRLYAGTDGNGFLYKSDNAGDTWRQVRAPFNYYSVQAIHVGTNQHLIVGTDHGLYNSNDDGLVWKRKNLDSHFILSLAENKNGDLFVGTADGLFHSKLNEDSLTEMPIATGVKWISSLFISDTGYLFAGTDKGIYCSSNNGQDWELSGLSDKYIQAFAMNAHSDILAATRKGIFLSTNFGNTWNDVSTGLSDQDVICLAVNSIGHIYAGTRNDGVYISTDDGISWTTKQNGLSDKYIWSLAFDSQGRIYAGTDKHGVFRSVKSTTNVDDQQQIHLQNFALDQNYPNPFSSSTTIRFMIPVETLSDGSYGHVTSLRVYDLLGREVLNLSAEANQKSEIVIRNSQLPFPGIYFYRLSIGNKSQTKIMSFLR